MLYREKIAKSSLFFYCREKNIACIYVSAESAGPFVEKNHAAVSGRKDTVMEKKDPLGTWGNTTASGNIARIWSNNNRKL